MVTYAMPFFGTKTKKRKAGIFSSPTLGGLGAIAKVVMISCIATGVPVTGGSALATTLLPDGRAWEMVSPSEKNGGEVNGIDGVIPNSGVPEGGIVQASADGSLVTYVSLLSFPGSNGSDPQGAPIAGQYLSTRKVAGWATENLTTAVNSGTYPLAGNGAPYKAFSGDLSKGLLLNGEAPVENPSPPLLVPAPPRYENYYLRDNSSGGFEALLTSAPAENPKAFFLALLGVTPDLSHIVLHTTAKLTPEAIQQERGNLYEWSKEWPQLIQPINVPTRPVNPGETADEGALLGMGNDESHTISNDGSRVFWSQPGTGSLFVRENVGHLQSLVDEAGNCTVPTDACTVQVDATRIKEPKTQLEESGRGEFMTASANGGKAFFTDRRRLTSDSTAGGERAHQDLYQFDVETGLLTDLTVDGTSTDPQGASVLGVLEASEDGSYVYFVAEGSLPGTGAVSGHDNMYVWHETSPGKGTTHFIAALSNDDSGHGGNHEPGVANDWEVSAGTRTIRLTANGQDLLFMSDERLTSYDNEKFEEVYLYNALAGNLICVSCKPSDARPIGPSGIPGGTPWRVVEELGTYRSRAFNDEGNRVFFDSRDALVPQDTNGAMDVYEWERTGTGTCHHENGCVFLLSGGTSNSDSSFVDASASGEDVFFLTRAQLVKQDGDQLRDLYDARVDGGFSPSAPNPPCEGEGCLPSPSSSSEVGSLASTTFNGMGNLALLPAKSKAKVKAKTRGKAKKHKHARKASRKAGVRGPHSLHGRR